MNLKQLSDLLGISQTTISRALNGYPEVSKDTRKRVEEAAKKYGYAPSSIARRLAGKRVEAVGIIQPVNSCMNSPYIFLETIGVISSKLREGKIDLFVVPGGSSEEIELYQRMITGGRVDSFLVEATRRFDNRIEWLIKGNFPFFSFGRTQVPGEYSWFDVDHRGGIKKACDALVELGHRRIAYLHQDSSLNYSWERLQGFEQSAKEHAIAAPVIVEGCTNEDSGYVKTMQLLGNDARPTAIICSSMFCAKGVTKAIAETGLRLGEDISVVAWDDDIADLAIPGMSVVKAPIKRSSERVGELLLQLIANDNKEVYQELQDVELVLSASVARCKHAG